MMKDKLNVFNFNYGWKFMLANAYPHKNALEAKRDYQGRYFYEPDYDDSQWQDVGIPHTFNDGDMFVNRIEDAGTGQNRTVAFYRKAFQLPSTSDDDKKIIIEFEGIRQTCYLYVNGKLAGFSENGVAPFAFDISPYINHGGDNVIAIATDNTATRNIDACAAETPNHENAEPGNFQAQQVPGTVPPQNQGVGYFWNCNDFNPSVGGLTKNIRIHIKPKVYLTLNVYSNLQTKGVYVYAHDFDFANKSAVINVEAEVRNETNAPVTATLESHIVDHDGNTIGVIKAAPTHIAPANLPPLPPMTITPKDAYKFHDNCFTPVDDESLVAPTITDSQEVTVAHGQEKITNLNFWDINTPYLYDVYTHLILDGTVVDTIKTTTGFRKMEYNNTTGLKLNGKNTWLTGYAQRSSNEWAAIGVANDWLKDMDAKLIRESNANFIRWMHVAACPADIRALDRYGVVCVQPAGDKERENHGRQWDQRVELMRDIIIYFRNSPSILFWEAGNNSIGKAHMREMTALRLALDPHGGRLMGCRTINRPEVVAETEYVSTMLNRHAGHGIAAAMPILETEYSREESPRRVWDDYSPPDFDYDNKWAGPGGRKEIGIDCHDLTAEDFALATARGYSEFFNDRVGGASGKNLYSSAGALCWTDSAQHGRQAGSENARMSGRVDPVRLKKQNFDVFRVMQSGKPEVKILGHWNYPAEDGVNYKYPVKALENGVYAKTGEYAFRDPKNKTVYVCASYGIAKVELYVNGELVGVCDKPHNTFIFKFDGIDITPSPDSGSEGYISAIGYTYDNTIVNDRINTASQPESIRITPHMGAEGLLANGTDIAYCDIEILDKSGNICPLCMGKIDFQISGPAQFMGGYNSGRYNGYGKNDSPIHQNFVYAECGTNRVFIKAGVSASEITLKASMKGVSGNGISGKAKLNSIPYSATAISKSEPQVLEASKTKTIPTNDFTFAPIPQADASKYTPDSRVYCSVVINNGHEVDTKGNRTLYLNGAVWGPILIILDRIKSTLPGALDYTYDQVTHMLTVISGKNKMVANIGQTHLQINGADNLMDGEPTLRNGMLWMEINAIVSHIQGITAIYDEGVHIYRVDTLPVR
ncbi:MAG: beta galactosidase jelly roll domain-containing protein [Defluviitaleaceae bacterium]|nr:beta galactosidase jelly roll domain-containing protein [Defluviitaleaceae bacterium]